LLCLGNDRVQGKVTKAAYSGVLFQPNQTERGFIVKKKKGTRGGSSLTKESRWPRWLKKGFAGMLVGCSTAGAEGVKGTRGAEANTDVGSTRGEGEMRKETKCSEAAGVGVKV